MPFYKVFVNCKITDGSEESGDPGDGFGGAGDGGEGGGLPVSDDGIFPDDGSSFGEGSLTRPEGQVGLNITYEEAEGDPGDSKDPMDPVGG